MNKSLIVNFFNGFYSHNYGYEKKKELRMDNQVVILTNQLSS